MADESADLQSNWADCSEAMDLDAAVSDQLSYADVTRSSRQRRGSSSSYASDTPDGDSLFVAYDYRVPDSAKGTIHPFNLLPDRPCSAHFTLEDKDIPASAIFDDLKNCGVRVSGVRCLQRSPNGFVSVTFSTAANRDLFLRKSASSVFFLVYLCGCV